MKKNILKIVFATIFIILVFFIYDMYQFAKGVQQDAINNKHKQIEGDFTIHRDSLYKDNSENHLLDSILQQEKDSIHL